MTGHRNLAKLATRRFRGVLVELASRAPKRSRAQQAASAVIAQRASSSLASSLSPRAIVCSHRAASCTPTGLSRGCFPSAVRPRYQSKWTRTMQAAQVSPAWPFGGAETQRRLRLMDSRFSVKQPLVANLAALRQSTTQPISQGTLLLRDHHGLISMWNKRFGVGENFSSSFRYSTGRQLSET